MRIIPSRNELITERNQTERITTLMVMVNDAAINPHGAARALPVSAAELSASTMYLARGAHRASIFIPGVLRP